MNPGTAGRASTQRLVAFIAAAAWALLSYDGSMWRLSSVGSTSICAALGVACLAAMALTERSAAQTQAVEPIVEQAVRAKGGLERIRAVAGLTMRGIIKANGADVAVTITTHRPHFFRQEVKVQGATIVQGFDGEQAWTLNPLLSPTAQRLPDEQARRMRDQADFDGPLVESDRKGIKIAYDKFERIEGRAAHCLRVTRPIGPLQRLCLDADTGREIRSSVEIDEEGHKARVDTMFADYREVAGLSLPFRVRTLVDGRPQSQLVIDTIEFSPEFDASLFRMP